MSHARKIFSIFSEFYPLILQTLNTSECCAIWNTKYVECWNYPFLIGTLTGNPKLRNYSLPPPILEAFSLAADFVSGLPFFLCGWSLCFSNFFFQWANPCLVQSENGPYQSSFWKERKEWETEASLFSSEALLYPFAVANSSLNGVKVSSWRGRKVSSQAPSLTSMWSFTSTLVKR